jgi:glycine C-acetyltransferase
LLVDDAHGFGTLGKTGAGAGEEQDCQDIDVYFSTLQSRWLILVLL